MEGAEPDDESSTAAQDYTKWSHSALVERVLELEKSMASFAEAQNRYEHLDFVAIFS